MIITKLMGGLGNQMFQYAAARRLSYLSSVSLKLDLAWFDIYSVSLTPRKYELYPFNIIEEFPSSAEIGNFLHGYKKFAGLCKFIFHSKHLYLREKHFHFYPRVLKLHKNVYLEGYWQSEKYFDDIKEIIRNDFSLKADPEGLNKIIAEELVTTDKNTVSVHIRRGDYVTNSVVNKFHGICSLSYYHTAIQIIVSQLRNPHFMIFSDDPEWVINNLKINHPFTMISHNGPENAHEDIRLMSLCKHHIIANSTFSWWGAWLCKNPDKVVIAPQQWFNNKKINTDDLLPEKWLRI